MSVRDIKTSDLVKYIASNEAAHEYVKARLPEIKPLTEGWVQQSYANLDAVNDFRQTCAEELDYRIPTRSKGRK